MYESIEQDSMPNSIRLFRVAGISVFLHLSWLLVAFYELQRHAERYDSIVWSIAEYLTLFGIVLLHEFGHAFACRSVGGRADRIMLWPLGGVAYVQAPPRPKAVLWSIAAGPLVNLLLVPVTIAARYASQRYGLPESSPDADNYLRYITYINLALLVFNILPIYPLDGGQMLQALLWMVIGRAKSLLVVTVIGFIVCMAGLAYAVYSQNLWLGIIAVYAGYHCFSGFQNAKILAEYEQRSR